MDLQIHLGQGLLHVLHVRRRHLHQTVAVTEEGTNDANSILGSKRGSQQPYRMEILQPLTIDDIALAPGNVPDMMSIHQAHLDDGPF
jgi:hypothetical protein